MKTFLYITSTVDILEQKTKSEEINKEEHTILLKDFKKISYNNHTFVIFYNGSDTKGETKSETKKEKNNGKTVRKNGEGKGGEEERGEEERGEEERGEEERGEEERGEEERGEEERGEEERGEEERGEEERGEEERGEEERGEEEGGEEERRTEKNIINLPFIDFEIFGDFILYYIDNENKIKSLTQSKLFKIISKNNKNLEEEYSSDDFNIESK
jgi:cobalamin biosynthesis protein CobT